MLSISREQGNLTDDEYSLLERYIGEQRPGVSRTADYQDAMRLIDQKVISIPEVRDVIDEFDLRNINERVLPAVEFVVNDINERWGPGTVLDPNGDLFPETIAALSLIKITTGNLGETLERFRAVAPRSQADLYERISTDSLRAKADEATSNIRAHPLFSGSPIRPEASQEALPAFYPNLPNDGVQAIGEGWTTAAQNLRSEETSAEGEEELQSFLNSNAWVTSLNDFGIGTYGELPDPTADTSSYPPEVRTALLRAWQYGRSTNKSPFAKIDFSPDLVERPEERPEILNTARRRRGRAQVSDSFTDFEAFKGIRALNFDGVSDPWRPDSPADNQDFTMAASAEKGLRDWTFQTNPAQTVTVDVPKPLAEYLWLHGTEIDSNPLSFEHELPQKVSIPVARTGRVLPVGANGLPSLDTLATQTRPGQKTGLENQAVQAGLGEAQAQRVAAARTRIAAEQSAKDAETRRRLGLNPSTVIHRGGR